MLRILVGIAAMIGGFLMTWKSIWMAENFGEQGWMVKVFGEGHASTGYKVVGIIVIFVSFLIITGLIYNFLEWFFAPIAGSLAS